MKTSIITITICFFFLVANSFRAVAQQKASAVAKAKFSIEIDPATFAFGGYGVHLRYSPKNCRHLLLGVGTYAMDMPDALIGINKQNKYKGWNVRLNGGYGLFGEYHFAAINRGWFAGVQAGMQQFKLKNEAATGSITYTNALTLLYGGYSWKPGKTGLYLKPWAGIGYAPKLSGQNVLQGAEYKVSPVTMFATLHVGYQF